MKTIRFSILIFIFAISTSFAVSPDMYNLQILMQENRQHFEFLNIVISNLTPPNAEDDIKAIQAMEGKPPKPEHDNNAKQKLQKTYWYNEFLIANKRDLEGSIYYFRGEYGMAYKPLKAAQEKLKEIYENALEEHNEITRVLITYAANRIVRSKDSSAQWLLKQAFRELKVAEDCYTMAWNYSPYQFRAKISMFEEGFRSSRKARRFALLAIMDYYTPKEDKATYRKQSFASMKSLAEDEYDNNYENMKSALRNYIENKFVEPKIRANINFNRPETKTPFIFEADNKDIPSLDLMEINDDIHQIITFNRISILEETNNVVKRDGQIAEAKQEGQAKETKTEAPAKDTSTAPKPAEEKK